MGIKLLIKKTTVLTGVLCVFLGVSCKKEKKDAIVVKKEENEAYEAIRTRLNMYFEALTSQKKFNGVVFVKKGTDSLFCKAYNLSKEEQSSTRVAVQSQFDIHSVSKVFAKQLLYQFQKDGLIKLSDTVSKFYSDFPQGDRITIEMLMNHTSGLPRELVNFEGNEFDLDHAALEAVLKQQPLLFEPGTKEQYSNVGYQLLYTIIGRINGTTFDDCVAKKIIIPNTLVHTGSRFYSNLNKEVTIAANHEKEGDSIVQIPNVNKDEFKQARMYSNVEDLMSFLIQLEQQSYALKMAGEDHVIQQSGGSDGVRAHVYLNLESEDKYVLLSNYERIPFRKILNDIEQILQGKAVEIPQPKNRKAIQLAHSLLNAYEGTYKFNDMNGLLLEFKRSDDGLIVYQEGEEIARLMAESKTIFFEKPTDDDVFEFVFKEQSEDMVLMGWKGVKLKGVKQQ